MAYATTAQLDTWLGTSGPADAERMLDRATELIDEVVVAPYDDDDTDVQDALADATCAQVEFWIEVGEEHDITGQRGEVELGDLTIRRLPSMLAPRARRALASQNLLTRSIQGA